MNKIEMPGRDELLDSLAENWKTLLALGLFQAVLGAAAVAGPQVATVLGTEFVGSLLLLAGAAQVAAAFGVKTWKGFALYLLGGLLNAGAGTALLVFPANAAIAITLVLAAILIVEGATRVVLAFREDAGARRVTFLLGGSAGMAVGVLLWWEWPSDAAWAVGLLLGFNLGVGGIVLAALALGLRGPGSGGFPTAPA